MVVDEQREIFSKLKDKSDYLKECLWQGKLVKNFRRKKERAGKPWLLEWPRKKQKKWQGNKKYRKQTFGYIFLWEIWRRHRVLAGTFGIGRWWAIF